MSGLDLRLDLRRGSFALRLHKVLPLDGLTAVFGPSGAGKSTLLRAIAGFEPTGGVVRIGDDIWEEGARFVPAHQRRIGFVFQEPQLFTHLDVAGNLAYAARRAGQMASVAKVAADLGLDALMARRVAGLSGGEAQRVALGRALLTAPRLLLMDEPLSSLDAASRAEILPLIERLRDQAKLPILYVSHSLGEVARLATRVLALHQGKVAAFGPTAEVLGDADAGPAFGGTEPGSLIEACYDRAEADGLCRLTFAGGAIVVPALAARKGEVIRLFVQARDVMIARRPPEDVSALNILAARVEGLHAVDGASVEVWLSLGGVRVRARITKRSAAALGLEPGIACFAILKSVALARD